MVEKALMTVLASSSDKQVLGLQPARTGATIAAAATAREKRILNEWLRSNDLGFV